MPDSTLSEAIREAYAAAPINQVVYHTIEIRHPAFTEPIRVVRDRVSLTATLEAAATANGGQAVTFLAFAFDLVPPEVSAAGSPTCVLEMDNVAGEDDEGNVVDVMSQIELAMSDPKITEVTYRQFISSDLSVPQNDPPLTMDVLAISVTPFKVRATCGYNNLQNRRFPRDNYTAQRFPGLVT